MFTSLKFTLLLLHLVWLGCVITVSFYVAPSLFSNESGLTPNSQIAGDIIAPLLHKMHVTGWILIPVMIALIGLIVRMFRLKSAKGAWAACGLLAAAWFSGLYSGTVITQKIHVIRKELAAEFGGYHLAPKEDPRRQEFGKLHGVSMMLGMLDLALGLGSLFCVTQTIEPRGDETKP
ncbi:DUF4149 domain-containing protein [Candidatus Sumerlaeota bacterium]|nr:DUF4149 domain-containing protein [Candidatus Sumerlaeota bacterium]